MAVVDIETHVSAHDRRRAEVREYRFTIWLAYAFFLFVAIAARLTPRRWRTSLPGIDGKRSVFAEARIAAATCIPFAYR